MRRVMIKGLLAHKLRLALTALSVVLGVGFVAGTFVLTDTLAHTFDTLFAEVNGKTDAQIRSTQKLSPQDPAEPDRGPVPATLLEAVRKVNGVAEAGGYVAGRAPIVGKDGKLVGGQAPSFGASASNLGTLSPFSIKAGRAPKGPDEAVIDAGTAKKEHFAVGDRVNVQASITGTYKIVGIVGFGSADNLAGASFVLWDTPTAQRVLHREGEFDVISVKATDGLSQNQLVDRLRPVLPASLEAVTSDLAAAQQANDVKQSLSFFSTFLLAFAAVSLFVGSFIIYNTFTIIVAQRLREMALLRALGASRKQVTRSVLTEGIIVGLFASIIGVGFGVLVAAGLRALLGAVGMDLPSTALVVKPRTIYVPVILGVVITTLSSWGPARKASKVPPVAAIRGADSIPEGRGLRRRLISGGLVLALGIAALAGGLYGGAGLALVGVGALVFYGGVAMLSPLVAGPLARVIGAPAARLSLPGRLGRLNAMRNPRRTSSTAAALMIGLGLVSFVTILAASLKTSFAATLDRSVKADYIVQGPNGGQQKFSREVALKMAQKRELQIVSPMRFSGEFKLDGVTKRDDAVDPYTFADIMDIDIRKGKLFDFVPGTMLVSDRVAEDKGWQVGQRVKLSFPRTGDQMMEIVAVYHDDALFSSGYIITLDDFGANAGDDNDSLVLAKRAKGVTDEAARAAVEPILVDYPSVELQDQAAYKKQVAGQIDKLLVFVIVLLLLAVVIALIGIVNTLALSIFERTRELGLLRAVGMGRRQMKRMIRWESIIITLLGAVLGLGVGAFFGWAAVSAMGDIGVDRLAFPAGRLISFVVVAGLAGVLAAVLPARRAARLDVLEAIAHQ
ncbi:MAG TPA: ABC transporter permease [Acidimicrobiia bacterium]|nr:ABC transporter permease [Acidimicrobiia bacterium]